MPSPPPPRPLLTPSPRGDGWKPDPGPDLPPVKPRRYFDTHVHPWPPRLYRAILAWFDRHGWRIEERLDGDAVDGFLAERGVERYLSLIYAHKPGLAADLNRWNAAHARRHPRAIPAATVHPDDDVEAVLGEAFDDLGLRLMKLHAHVMGIGPDDPRLEPVYRILEERRLPLVFHAGTEPASDAYRVPVDRVSGLDRLVGVLDRHPGLTLIVPHLGAGEFDRAAWLLERFPNVHLDCAMLLAGYFPHGPDRSWILRYHRRILYGTDFPILPYPYDRERRSILAMDLGEDAEEALFWGNAARIFGT